MFHPTFRGSSDPRILLPKLAIAKRSVECVFYLPFADVHKLATATTRAHRRFSGGQTSLGLRPSLTPTDRCSFARNNAHSIVGAGWSFDPAPSRFPQTSVKSLPHHRQFNLPNPNRHENHGDGGVRRIYL